MSNAAGYIEDDAQLERDLEWNKSVEGRNRVAARKLLEALKAEGVVPSSVLEIGCGIGVLLDEYRGLGIGGLGYDINRRAVEYGRAAFGADLRCELWDHRSLDIAHDLVLCISVLEHIAEPRPLISEIAKYCGNFGGKAFISVPFVGRDRWHYLLDPNPMSPGTPFFDNDVHITHFTCEGLERALVESGAHETKFVRGGLWEGYIARF